ncbi:MAG TPA: NBR1-Ig-like domain-containing protein, partial [Thermomicrobiales bacterium]
YQLGTYTVLTHNADGHPAGLLGEFSSQGWWYYFLVAFALKTALPVLLLTLAGLGWAAWRVVRARDWRFLLLLGPLLIFAASTMSSHINIGVRHFLPVFPFCFLLGGALLDRLLGEVRQSVRGRRVTPSAGFLIGPALVVILLGWLVVESVRAYPDDLTYMNQLASGEPHWYYLSDSNVEWGQDVGALAAYLRQQGETTVREAIATPETLSYLGITPLDLFAPETASAPPTRYIAIGASFLNGSVVDMTRPGTSQDIFAAYRHRTPEKIFGGSIYLYRTDGLPNPPALTAPLPEGASRATITIRDQPTQLRAGEKRTLRLRVTNNGQVAWPATDQARLPNQLRIGNRWFTADGNALVQDDGREPLAFPILPGETGDLQLTITAPSQAGTYTLDIDVVQEAVAWFAARGGTPLRIMIRVAP